jgi:hypothetical protein
MSGQPPLPDPLPRSAEAGEREGAARPPDPAAEAERARRLRRAWALVQAGAMVFLVVVMLGLLPTILARWFPGLGGRATVAVLALAPAVPVAFLVVAALRLRR